MRNNRFTYTENPNREHIFEEYNNGIHTTIIFQKGRVKTSSKEAEFSPIEESNIGYYEYQRKLNDLIDNYKFL